MNNDMKAVIERCKLVRNSAFNTFLRSNFCRSIDGGTGSEKNGTWDGMVGMLVRGEAEVGASSFLMTVKRLDVVDYTYSIDEAG